jgi:putative endonuclease
MSDRKYAVYMLTNKKDGVLYVGMTNNIHRRIYEHKEKMVPGFTKKFNLTNLVYMEEFESADQAHENENRLKKWHRNWKVELIEKMNPEWKDLSSLLC